MERWLNKGVAGVGAASLLSDTSHELTTSLLPSLVTSLGSGAGALGVLEGVSDALTGVSKLAGGTLASDPERRGRLASGGYVGTAVATALIGVAVAVWQIALLRAFAWISRGLRAPARDMLLTTVVPREAYGRAAGVERAGDNLGAVLGPLFAAGLVTLVGLRWAIGLSLVPGLLAAIAITVTAQEARRRVGAVVPAKARLKMRLGELRRAGLMRALLPIALLELGNLATTLLILRATGVFEGGSRSTDDAVRLAAFVYAGHNLLAALAALLAGAWVDRSGPRRTLQAGALCFVAGYGLLAAGSSSGWWIAGGFLLSGAGIGLAEPAETAWVALALPDTLRADGFGLLGLVQAVGDLGATLVAGLLWAAFSAGVAFTYAAGWMALSVLAVAVFAGRTTQGRV